MTKQFGKRTAGRIEVIITYVIGRKKLFFEFIHVIRCLNMQVFLYILHMVT